jgi:hypothetical protein
MYYSEDTNITAAFPNVTTTGEHLYYIYRYCYQDDTIFDIPINNIRDIPYIFELVEVIKKLLCGFKVKRFKQLILYE